MISFFAGGRKLMNHFVVKHYTKSPSSAPWMIRHITARVGLTHRSLEVLMNLRILVFEFDLAAAVLDAREGAALTVL